MSLVNSIQVKCKNDRSPCFLEASLSQIWPILSQLTTMNTVGTARDETSNEKFRSFEVSSLAFYTVIKSNTCWNICVCHHDLKVLFASNGFIKPESRSLTLCKSTPPIWWVSGRSLFRFGFEDEIAKISKFSLKFKFVFLQGMIKSTILGQIRKVLYWFMNLQWRYSIWLFEIMKNHPSYSFFCDLWWPLMVVFLSLTSSIQKAIII